MRTRLLLTMFFVLLTAGALAGTRTKEEMKEAAMRVLVKNRAARGMTKDTPSPELKEYLTKEKLSILGSEDLGFAVVANDDRFEEVIGYSESSFTEAMPCGFKWWLDAANEAMENSDGEMPAKARVMNATNRGNVGPLITTKWGQSRPYNNNCKITINGNTYSMVTGCVATAMAQVMNYYKYPQKGKGENSYTIKYVVGNYTLSANFENSYYDWDNMLDDYSDYFYLKPADKHTAAVAKLMSDCGIAVNMEYNGCVSGAYPKDIPIGMKNFFSYSFFDKSKTIYYRNNYPNSDEWMTIIYNALSNNHPIIYNGYGTGGHCFVIHGYEPNGKVYVNWGWDGRHDGYYKIDMLTPGGDNYNNSQNMIIPIPEGTTGETNYTLSYIVDGIIYKEYKCKYGDAITPEPAPTKEGYTFSGWSEIPKTMPAKDVKVTGSFSKGTYKLIYMVDGEVYKTVYYDYGVTIAPEAVPTKDGYSFSGWSDIPKNMPAKDVTVTGGFTLNKYTLTYEVDGKVYKTYEYDYGAKITPEAEPTKDGYTFSGWSNIPSTMPNHNFTITGYFRMNNQSPNTVTVEIDGIYYILIGNAQTAEVTSSPNYNYSGNVMIPETVEYEGFTYQVTQIGDKAFSFCGFLSSISIPESVTKIGNSAFDNCYNLSSIVLPNSIQDIGDHAFISCSKLSSVILSDGITMIRPYTFSYCSALKSIKIPEIVTSVGANAFISCSALESISLPTNLSNISENCFNGCQSLSSIEIPEKVTTISSKAFYGCTNLKTVTMGNSVRTIYSKAFGECKSLESITCLAEMAPSANNDAFENSYIEYVTLYVPGNSVNKYKSQEPWSKFGQIIAIPGSTKYTLTYLLDGQVYKIYQLVAGVTITPEPTPTKEGYTFTGWSDIPSTMPAHDVTVTGSFERHYDVGNVVSLVNLILTGIGGNDNLALYDVNNDGKLNIGDLILVVRSVLNSTSKSAATRAIVDMAVPDLSQYSAAQFVLNVPNNISEQDISLVKGVSQTHQMICRQIEPGAYAVVIYSLTNSLFRPEEGGIIEVNTENADSGDLTIQDVVLAKPNGETERFESMPIVTVIPDVERQNVHRSVYDLKGLKQNRVEGLRKGIYIENGKKVVVR